MDKPDRRESAIKLLELVERYFTEEATQFDDLRAGWLEIIENGEDITAQRQNALQAILREADSIIEQFCAAFDLPRGMFPRKTLKHRRVMEIRDGGRF